MHLSISKWLHIWCWQFTLMHHIVLSKDLEQSLVEETTKLFNVYNANFLVEMETKVEKIDIYQYIGLISKLLDSIRQNFRSFNQPLIWWTSDACCWWRIMFLKMELTSLFPAPARSLWFPFCGKSFLVWPQNHACRVQGLEHWLVEFLWVREDVNNWNEKCVKTYLCNPSTMQGSYNN